MKPGRGSGSAAARGDRRWAVGGGGGSGGGGSRVRGVGRLQSSRERRVPPGYRSVRRRRCRGAKNGERRRWLAARPPPPVNLRSHPPVLATTPAQRALHTHTHTHTHTAEPAAAGRHPHALSLDNRLVRNGLAARHPPK